MGQRASETSGHQRGACVRVTGTLRHEQAPTAKSPVAVALIDYGQGQLRVRANSPEEVDRLTAIGQESTVLIEGPLLHHTWQVGNGRRQELYEVIPESIELLHDARRERMLP